MNTTLGIPNFAMKWPWFMSPVAYSINAVTCVKTVQHELAEKAAANEIWRYGQ